MAYNAAIEDYKNRKKKVSQPSLSYEQGTRSEGTANKLIEDYKNRRQNRDKERQSALNRLRNEFSQGTSQEELNQQRVALTDFRRQEREDTAAYLEKRRKENSEKLVKSASPAQLWDVTGVEKLAKDYQPEQAEDVQTNIAKNYEALRAASDYAELAKKGKTLKHGLSDQAYVGNETGYFLKSYNTYYLTPEERELYNYILAKEGEKDAKAYLDAMNETMNQRASGKWQEAAENIGKEMPVRGALFNTFLSTAAAPTGILYVLAQQAAEKEVDMNSPHLQGSRMEAATREGIKENQIPVVGKPASDFLIDTGLSMAQSMARLPMGATGLALAGGAAATGGYLDAKDRGASEGQALLAGTAQGAAEAFFEKYSLEGLKTLKAGSVTSARELFKNIGKQAFTEGTEEMFTEFANYASDRVIMGELSNYELSLQNYMDQGMSEKEAKEKAYADLVKNIALAGAGGALSGGIMGGGAQALGTYLNGRNSNVEDYQEYADSIETDEAAFESKEEYETAQTMRTLAEEMVEKQQAGKELTAMEKGYFENAVNDMAVQAQKRATVEAEKTAEDTQTDISSPEQEKGSDVAHSEPQEYIFGDLTEEFGENGRTAIEEQYDESMDVPGYFKAFSRYYNAGRYNMDMSEADRFASSALLTEEQAKAAFKAGAQDRNMEIGYDPETGEMKGLVKGEAKTGGLGYAAASATEAQKKVADAIGKRTGLKIEIVDDIGTDKAVASYTQGVIRISANAKNFNAAVSHELTHFIKDYSADMYQLYEDTAVKAITRAEGVDIEDMIERYSDNYFIKTGKRLNRSETMEEIVADATEKFFNDPEYIDSIVKESRTLGEKILDFIEDMIDALKSLMKTGSTKQAANALAQNLELYERSRTYWMQALQEGGDRYKEGWEKAGKGKKYQLLGVDENGIEIYELSNGAKELTMNQRKALLLDSVLNEYRGRTAKFNKDGKIYYAALDRKGIRKGIYGDKKSDKSGYRAKIDIGADGNYFELVENSKYANSSDEQGKVTSNRAHVDVKNWDYYHKTIMSDGVKYDVLINVRDTGNEQYVYDVTLKRKKEQDSSAAQPKLALGPRNPVKDSIADNEESVNKNTEIQAEKIGGKESAGDSGIRFQLEDVDDHQEAMADLIKENQELKEANEHLKKQFELTSKEALRQSDVDRVARDILTKYGSNYKKQTLTSNLTRLYEYIRSADVDPSELSQVAGDMGRSILKNSTQVDNTLAEQYKETRKKIRDTKISISDQDKEDLATVGGYNNFRKKYFGRMKLGNDGISVDSLYEELAGEVPEMFNLDITHPADRLQQIGNFLDITQSQVSNPYHANMDEMAYLVGQEILEAYTTIRNPPATMADRYEAKYQKARDDYRRKIQEYKDKTVTQYDAILADKNRELGLIKDNHERDLLVQKEKYEQKMQQRRDSLTKREAKNRIIKEVTAMQKWLLEPTDTKHIPQELRGVVANFLSNIDFSSKDDYSGVVTQRTKAWDEAYKKFIAIKNAAGTIVDDEGNTVYIDVDPDLAARIEELGKTVEGIEKLEDLDVYSMEELKKTVISMKKALTEVNQMKSNVRYRQMSLLAEDVFRDTENLRNSTEYTETVGKGNKLMNYDMLDPQTMFGKIGPAFKTTYDSLRKGLDKKTIRLKEAEDYFNKALEESGISRSDVRKWTGTNAPTHTFDVAGKKIEMSIPQIMSLYELDKRGQARKHMYDRNGGIKPDDLKLGISLDNKSAHIPQKKRSYAPVRVNRELVRQITSVLTLEQKKLADALQRFMGDQVSQWGNETSMEMYGYEKFTAKDYFPIVTDKNYIMQPEGTDRGKASIRNLGITKSVNKYANNPLIIEDIFEVFTRQVDQMSSYNAYVLPLSDLHKVMNYKDMRGFNGSSIKEELTRVFGKSGVDYIDKLVDDINGSVRHESDLGDILISNMKAASVAGNLRVAVQQPTSIARAAAEINLKYLAQGVAKIEDGRWEKIVKYAPIAQWKDWGFYQMQTSRAMKDVLVGSDSAKQRFVNKTMILAELGDKIAWNRLWSACELETADKYPKLQRDSEEFYRRVGERFSEVVDKTQVVDSVLHRTHIMRNSDGYKKMVTSFLGEPLKSYNMLYRAFYDAKMNRPGATKKLRSSVAAYVASGFLTAAAASFVDAFRDDDREKTYAEKYKDNFWSSVKDNINILNSLPFVKDVMSIAGGYTVSRTDMSGFQDLYYAYKKIDSWKKGNSPYTSQYLLLNTAQALSKVTGVPVKSITRDVIAIVDTVFNIAGGESDYKWLKLTYNIQNNKTMYVEMLMQAEDIGNKELTDTIKDDLIRSGMTEADIDDKMNDVVNKIIKDEVNLDEAIQEYDALKKESKETFVSEAQKYINLKMRAGWDKDKCITEIRKKITAVYKPLWQQATTQAERDAIIKKCKSFYYGGNSIYKDYDFSKNWKAK